MGLQDLRIESLASEQEKEPTKSVTKLTNEKIAEETKKLEEDIKKVGKKEKKKKNE